LLVFAATPPPHHGQSYAVKILIDGLEGEGDVTVYHVNCRYSAGLDDIGRFSFGKIPLLLNYCAQAIWYRFRFGVTNLYYVPAPGRRTPLYRDWLVMLLCRPFFRQIVFHWHAVGLVEWLEKQAKPWERALSHILLARHNLSIVLANSNRSDAAKLKPRNCVVVPNGIPDPCPDFESRLSPRRIARTLARRKLLCGQSLSVSETNESEPSPLFFRVLFLSLCTREKGLFACLEAVALLNRKLRGQGVLVRAALSIAGSFCDPAELTEFEARVIELGLRFLPASSEIQYAEDVVIYHGFIAGENKRRLFEENDVFCFPTFYSAESFGIVLIEAMAFGLPIVTTRWRSIPELMPEGYPGLVEPKDPQAISDALETILRAENSPQLRSRFLSRFTEAHYIRNMQDALVRQLSTD
jgi:glycosyltransferase involved in cell wall biosynthesis